MDYLQLVTIDKHSDNRTTQEVKVYNIIIIIYSVIVAKLMTTAY